MTDTPQEDDRWTGPETATFAYHPITLLNDHPLPLGEDEAASLWNHNEQLQQEYNEPPHPDELHEAYTSKITETEMWEAFRIPLVGFTNRLYFWTQQKAPAEVWRTYRCARRLGYVQVRAHRDYQGIPIF